VRAAAIAALGNFSKDPAVYRALVGALHQDSSYAVEAAAAQDLGRSGAPQAFDVLQAEAQSEPEIHVLQATLMALAATQDPRAAAILLAYAQPGRPERVRLYALAGLGSLNQALAQDHVDTLLEVVRAALRDPFYPVQAAGEQLVAAFHLAQFEADIQREAERAPMAMQRKVAQKVLDRLQHQK
ncbi:MAG TPA: HEAT repeat domain-containing protein, partial [Terriglobales bacterium]|nr:HEAT repeat domain-containing protein [Terriglobales bacterium]